MQTPESLRDDVATTDGEAFFTQTTRRAYPHHQSLASWLETTCQFGTANELLHLLPLVDSAWMGEDRLKLHQRLWLLWQEADPSARAAARRQLDGRHVPWCDLMDRPWSDVTLTLARAHLRGGERPLDAPTDPKYVSALLSGDTSPAARWVALHARMLPALAPINVEQAKQAAGEALTLIEQGGATVQEGLAFLFELAVRSGDAESADAFLAECLSQGGAPWLSETICLWWLEGCEVRPRRPLALRQPRIKPEYLADAAQRASLHNVLHRQGPRARLARLSQAMGQTEEVPAATTDFRMLGALDYAWHLAETGRLTDEVIRLLGDAGALPAQTEAALACALGHQYLHEQEFAAAARQFARSRWLAPSAESRAGLDRVLRTINETPTALVSQALAGCKGAGRCGGASSAEAAAWLALATTQNSRPLKPLAAAMVARLYQHGALESDAVDRRQHLPAARRLWQALTQDADHREEAIAALKDERRGANGLRWPAHWHTERPGREHLLVKPTAPANGQWLVVFSCLQSRHTFTQVDNLVTNLPGHHLLFVNNPEFNWYSDQTFVEICEMVRERVLSQVTSDKVCCYFGSMGGTGAMKLALELGLRAVVFNPQTDLDLWASFRPGQRQQLWGADRFASPLDWPSDAWAKAPLYLACGSATADRLAFSALIPRWRRARQAHLILEKFPDPEHAGLIKRIACQTMSDTIESAARRLTELTVLPLTPEPGWFELSPTQQAHFWEHLDAARSAKVEIVVRDGRMWVSESSSCKTRLDAESFQIRRYKPTVSGSHRHSHQAQHS